MISYRTLVFGAVVFVCAAAPVLADSVPAMPKAKSIVSRPMDSVPAMPKAIASTPLQLGGASIVQLIEDLMYFSIVR
ncbi:MAG: hypothetical protein ABR508_12585 [Candidatus Baltobacteraceae bacterium]